ncbi:MAG: ABC transporter permease subunit [Chloroflexi bacterium]|nr:ABC transporter permease subunit [Chloroflexota bacterium]
MAVLTAFRESTLWRRRRTRRWIVQSWFGFGVALVLLYVASRATRLQLGLDFMGDRAGFAIGHQWLTDYTGSESRFNAYAVGVFNTVRLVLAGLALATLLGIVAGVARLSKNWLVSRLATAYVEIFRNTPLLIQIIFWYTAVLLQLPNLERGVEVLDVVFLSNRALAVPWAYPEGAFVAWLGALVIAAAASWLAHRWRVATEERTGRPANPNTTALAVFLGIAVVGFVAAGTPLRPELPERGVAGAGIQTISGGMQVTPEFSALLLALVIYTGAFIAEIVRGSIQALPRGQTEAAMAVGLGGYERMTLVILPQALRIMIPPLTNQYLNLTKNSSLAVAIAYPDLVFVGRTIQNNAGYAVPVFLAIMATYLVMSFLISAIMNWLNRRVPLGGR